MVAWQNEQMTSALTESIITQALPSFIAHPQLPKLSKYPSTLLDDLNTEPGQKSLLAPSRPRNPHPRRLRVSELGIPCPARQLYAPPDR